MVQVYKKTTIKEIENRAIQKVDDTTKNSVNNIILNFVNYFKIKHL